MAFQWLRSHQIEFALNGLYALVGALSLLAWWRDRKQWLLLCMAGYTLTQVFALIIGGLLIPLPFSVTVGLLQPLLMLQDVSLWYLLLLLLKLDDNQWIVRLMKVWVTVFCVAFLLDGLTTAVWGTFPATTLADDRRHFDGDLYPAGDAADFAGRDRSGCSARSWIPLDGW